MWHQGQVSRAHVLNSQWLSAPCPPTAELPLPVLGRGGEGVRGTEASSEHICTSGGFQEFVPVFIKSFSTDFELPLNNKAPSSAAWFNGEIYCISILLLQSDNEAKLRSQRESLFRRIQGFNVIHPTWIALQAGEQVGPSWTFTQVGCILIKTCQWQNQFAEVKISKSNLESWTVEHCCTKHPSPAFEGQLIPDGAGFVPGPRGDRDPPPLTPETQPRLQLLLVEDENRGMHVLIFNLVSSLPVQLLKCFTLNTCVRFFWEQRTTSQLCSQISSLRNPSSCHLLPVLSFPNALH